MPLTRQVMPLRGRQANMGLPPRPMNDRTRTWRHIQKQRDSETDTHPASHAERKRTDTGKQADKETDRQTQRERKTLT